MFQQMLISCDVEEFLIKKLQYSLKVKFPVLKISMKSLMLIYH